METRQAIRLVTEAACEATDTVGAPNDRLYVERVITGDLSQVTKDDLIYVGRIPLGNFYAFSAKAFDSSDFWDRVKEKIGDPNLEKPSDLGIDSHIIQIAFFITPL